MQPRQSRFQQLVPQRILALRARMEREIWFAESPLSVWAAPADESLGAPPADESPGAPPAAPSTVPAAAPDRAAIQGKEPLALPHRFGPPGGGWESRSFYLQVPPAGKPRYLWWDCDGEATVYHQGRPWAGLDVAHRWCRLPSDAEELLIEVALYQTAIWIEGAELPADHRFELRQALVKQRNEELWDLFWDLSVLCDVGVRLLSAEGVTITRQHGYNQPHAEISPSARFLWHRLEEAADRYETGDLPGMKRTLKETYRALTSAEYRGTALFFGHAHIDLVWLWPLRETWRKGIHTFATVLRLMEHDEEFVFQHSSPYLLRWIEREQPELWREIDRRINEGRWEISGAMELESDLWLTSGEGLVRSFRWGQEYFQEKTGHPADLVWLPDVFGYPDCLPQLMKLSGARWFFTQKLAWSSITRFPMTAFTWRGSDGSEVLGYMSPVGYNGDASVEETETASKRNQQSGIGVPALMPVGFGDGGGGPTEEMLERARRQRSLSPLPQTHWKTPSAAFREIESIRESLPRYSGELFLEYHRGTYTSQKRFKTLLRRTERLILLLEAWRAARGKSHLTYGWWEPLLLSQFHDAVPGSSIGIVYAELTEELDRLREAAERELTESIGTIGDSDALALFFPRPFGATITVETADTPDVREALEARALAYQRTGENLLFFRSSVTGFGFHRLAPPDGPTEYETVTVTDGSTGIQLCNRLITATIDPAARLTVTATTTGDLIFRDGVLRAYADTPAHFDAWDIDQHVERLTIPVRVSAVRVREAGPLRATVEYDVLAGESRFQLVYQLVAGEAVVRARLFNGWQESHRLLRWECGGPLDYPAVRVGGPFGSTRRDIRPGADQHDAAWEMPGHLWAALVSDSESEGIAIVSEGSYGFRATPEKIGVSLIRSPDYPDATADRGAVEVSWAVGAYRATAADTVSSLPITARMPEILYGDTRLGPGPEEIRPCPVTFLETGSLADSGIEASSDGGGFLIRMHETAGMRGTAVFQVNDEAWRVSLVDVLHHEIPRRVKNDGSQYRVEYRPYEILTLSFRRR